MADRTVHTSLPFGRKTLTPGTPFRIEGSRETFVFLRWVVTDSASWVEASDSRHANRAFTVDRITKVLPMPKETR